MKQTMTWLGLMAVTLLVMVGCGGDADTAHVEHQQVEPAAAAQAEVALDPDYPVAVCVVSGHALDSMGGPVALEHEGQQVQICCGGCEGAFRSEPEKYLAMVAAARSDQAD